MSAVETLLRDLGRLDIRVWVEGDRLRYSAPKSGIDEVLLGRLRTHKPELLSLLSQAAAEPARSIPRVPRDANLLPSFGQERLWFLQQFEGASAAYNIPSAMRVEGPLNLDALRHALNRIVQRHEVLRTRFADRDGNCVVIIDEQVPLNLPLTDLSHLEPAARDSEVLRLATEEFRFTFDLSQAPLLRMSVLRLGPQEHVVLINLHHIVSDGWSSAIFVSEFCGFYDEYVSGTPAAFPPLTIQYADYAADQRRRLARKETTAELAFWTRLMEGVPPAIDLPGDRPRPGVQSFRGGSVPVRIPNSVAEPLRALSVRSGATLFMTLLAAFAAVLHRWSRQTKIAVGSPVANRTSPEIEPLIGFFLNTLVLPVDLGGNPSFRELLTRVRQLSLDVFTHQHCPFEHLVEALQPVRTLTYSPVFQVMFILQNNREAAVEVSGLQFSPISLPSATEKFDLSLALSETSGQEIAGELGYSMDLFDPGTAARFAEHLENFVAAAAVDPDLPVSELPMMSARERRLVLEEWNATSHPLPGELRIHALVEQQVRRTPDAIALVFEDASITYREYNSRANRLAHYLISLGVGPEVRVGICVDRSLEMMVALLAVLKAGGAYIPLDTSYPASRIAFMLEDAEVAVLLTLEGRLASLPQIAASVLCLDSGSALFAEQPDNDPRSPVTADNLAYIIYTSGSTGRPKGVMNAHRGVGNRLLWGQRTFGMKPDDSIVQKTPIGFDVSVWEMFWPLTTGARLVIAKPEGHRDSAYLVDLIERHGITMIHFVAPMLGGFLDEDLSRCGSLRRVLTSGEALSLEMQRRFYEKLRVPLNDLYGPTEAAIEVSHWECDPTRPLRSVPIGKPVSNTRLYILDRDFEPAPLGVPGELFIGGICVARGYWKRPGLTASVFVPDPHSPVPGALMYRTGDGARFFPDGNIDFLGRLDHQIKIRGFRVELGEIENALQAIPSIREACVLMVKNRIAAWLIPAGDKRAQDDLRAALAVHLPEHMIPSHFIFLDEFPIAPNGKLNRAALPAPVAETSDEAFAAPRTPAEIALAEIWADVLGRPRVGIHDDYFGIGGDSIGSTRIAARARRAGYRISLKQIFRYKTVAELAAVAELIEAAPDTVITDDSTPIPLTPVQRRFLETAEDPKHYNQAVLLEFASGFNPERLRPVLAQLVERHDALRVRFRFADGGWVQHKVSASAATPALRILDGPIGPHMAALHAGIDPVNGPLFKAAFGEGRLLLILHHLVVDGVSWRILIDELSALLDGRKLPPPGPTFAAWARRATSHGDELVYWKKLARSRFSALPTDFDAPAEANTFASLESLTLEREATEHPALQEALLGSLVDSLAVWSGDSAVLLELEGHGRTERAGETVGWFTTAWPMLLQRSASPELTVPAIRFQLDAVPEGGAGFGVLRSIERHPDLVPMPQPEVCFNYLGRFTEGSAQSGGPLVGFADGDAGPMISPAARRTHRIEVTAVIARNRLRVTWAWSRNLHRRETITKLAEAALAALEAILRTPQEFEAIYPLTPSQTGILIESLARPGTGIHVEQSSWTVRGTINPDSLTESFAAVTARHPSLRTSFLPEARPAPLQRVHRELPSPVQVLDWRDSEAEPVQLRLDMFLAADRSLGFDLTTAPLFRLTAIRLTEDRWQLVATYHHLVIDGWSLPIVFADAMLPVADLPSAAGYRDYVLWLARRDSDATEAFWRRTLRGVGCATHLTPDATGDRGYATTDLVFDEALTARLQSVARDASVTLNTLMQGAWALALCWRSSNRDVVFGQTVSGRPDDLPRADSIVGMFTNTIPVRCSVPDGMDLAGYLGRIQTLQIEANGHTWCSSAQIHQWSGLPASSPLYETIFVFENYPVERVTGGDHEHFEVLAAQSSGARTNTPLTVLVAPGSAIRLHAVADASRWSDEILDLFFQGLTAILQEFGEGRAPEDILASLPPAPVTRAAVADSPQPNFVAPRTATEARMTALWEELLGVSRVSVTDGFFEAGGHSLLALRLIDRIESSFGRTVPLSALVQAPTVEGLASLLDSGSAESQVLVPLRANNPAKPAVFCVHPLGGTVVCYAELARLLGSDFQIYGLQARGVEDAETPADTLDAMAAHYVNVIRSASSGPWRLVGYSFGGFVALRMAALLQESGETVEQVILLDVPHPSVVPEAMARTDDSGLLVSLFAGSLDLDVEELRAMDDVSRMNFVFARAREAGLVPPGMPFKRARRYFEIARANHHMQFEPIPCTFPVTQIRAEEQSERISPLPDLGWRSFVTGTFGVAWSPGIHETMLNQPHVGRLAELMHEALSEGRFQAATCS